MSKLYTISFSPTGTSLKVANQIAEAFDCEKIAVDLCKPTTETIQIEQQAVCIFSLPCYGGRIPQTAAKRLSHIHGLKTPAIVCVTFGNRAFEDALLELADLVQSNGFQVIAGCAAVTEHNIVHIFGQGRPDELDQEEIHKFSIQVAQKVKDGKTDRPFLPGNFPYKQWHSSTTPILVNEKSCVSCGLCAQNCPVKAISSDGHAINQEICINCMRCVQICPNKSRSLPEEYVSALIQKLSPVCQSRKSNQFYL